MSYFLPATGIEISYAATTIGLISLSVAKHPAELIAATGGAFIVAAIGSVASRALFALAAALGAKAVLGTAAVIGFTAGWLNAPYNAPYGQKFGDAVLGAITAIAGCVVVYAGSAAFNAATKVLGMPVKWLNEMPVKSRSTGFTIDPSGRLVPIYIIHH